MKYYYCPRCHGKFVIPPSAKEIIHICPVLNNEKVVIPVSEIKRS